MPLCGRSCSSTSTGGRLRRHHRRSRRQELVRLREQPRQAGADGVNVGADRADLEKTAAQIIERCDRELSAKQGLAPWAATVRGFNATPEELSKAAMRAVTRRNAAVLDRTWEVLTAWHWASIAKRRRPGVLRDDEKPAVDRRYWAERTAFNLLPDRLVVHAKERKRRVGYGGTEVRVAAIAPGAIRDFRQRCT